MPASCAVPRVSEASVGGVLCCGRVVYLFGGAGVGGADRGGGQLRGGKVVPSWRGSHRRRTHHMAGPLIP